MAVVVVVKLMVEEVVTLQNKQGCAAVLQVVFRQEECGGDV